MNPKISKLKAEKEKNLKKIADMNARNEEIDKLITELENLDIIGLVRECRITPEELAIEKLYFQNNQKTAIMVAEARGVILLAAQKLKIPIYEYTPLQVKTAVTGYGKAKKPQVMEMTRKLLHLSEVPKPDDTADALAIAICHAQAAGSALRRTMFERRIGE